MNSTPQPMLAEIFAAAAFAPEAADVTFAGADPVFPLPLRIGEAGAAAIAATGVAAAELWRQRTGRGQCVHVDVDAAAPATTQTPRFPGDGGGIYLTADDRWIYLHGGFEHHRERISGVLQCTEAGDSIARAVAGWQEA